MHLSSKMTDSLRLCVLLLESITLAVMKDNLAENNCPIRQTKVAARLSAPHPSEVLLPHVCCDY